MSRELNLVAPDLESLDAVAFQLLEFAGTTKIFLFSAQMGAGKTATIKSLCKALQSNSDFSSPTYSIVNEYQYPGGKIFHFDLYRLNSLTEALDIGIEEYLDSDQYCFVEWPDLLKDLPLSAHLRIEISIVNNIRYFRAIQD